MQRLALIALALLVPVAPESARATPVFLFDQPGASPNDRVTVRVTASRAKPQQPFRLYLVRADLAGEVRSRLDPRVNFIGGVVPGRNGRGLLRFSVPPLDAGEYTLASWDGRAFAVQERAQLAHRLRPRALLRLGTTQSCPVTLPNANRPPDQPRSVSWHGNGLLWAGLEPTGIYAVPQSRVESDGSIFDKLPWVTTPRWRKPTVSGERIDAPAPPLRVRAVTAGSFSSATTPSFMSAVSFPTAGCWRLQARVADVSLTYVVEVVVTPPAAP